MKKQIFLRQRVFHDGTSMIVAKAGESHPVPVDLLADFIEDKSISDPNAKTAGKTPVADEKSASPFTSVHKGGGRYEITGPGLAEPELVAGKDATEKRVAELTAAHAAAQDGSDDDGAPNE